jgi:hypothetical protein
VGFAGDFMPVCVQLEVSVLGGHIHYHLFDNGSFGAEAVGDEVLNRNEGETPLVGELAQVREASHGAVFLHDFYDHGYGRKACQAHKIDGGFGVARSAKDSFRSSNEGKNMSGSGEVFRLGGGVG